MANNHVEQIITQAIKSKREVRFTYDKPGDFAKGLREGYPHALYYTKTTGKTKVDVYQTGGDTTNRTTIPGWKPFDVEYIRTIDIIDETFTIQQGYNSNSARYINSIVKL